MMENPLGTPGLSLVKRALEGGPDGKEVPPLALGVVFLTTLAFAPLLLFTSYTLGHIYPALAMVEDPQPPAYEPVSLAEEAEEAPAAATTAAAGGPTSATAHLRAVNRLLYSIAGWRSSFRGLLCAVVITLLTWLAAAVFAAIPFVPVFVGILLASLALVQLHTAWVHIVISNPSALGFWRRLPPFRRTFEATCIPVFAFWAASTLATWVPALLARVLDLPHLDPNHPSQIPEYHNDVIWKALIIWLVAIAINALVCVPAHVVLVRIQASLLPPEEDAIVSFDRSFKGAVEPAIVGGKGYATWRDALKTFPRSSWIRLYVLYIKVFLVSLAAQLVYFAVIIPEFMLLGSKKDRAD